MKIVTMLSWMRVFRSSRALFNYSHLSAFYTTSYNVSVPKFRRILLSLQQPPEPNSVSPTMDKVPYS